MATAGEQTDIAHHIQRITEVSEEILEDLAPISGYARMPLVPLEQAVEPLVSILPDVQSYAYAAKRKCKQPADNLTQDESAAILLYTMGWEPLDECLYIVLNKTLRLKDRKESLKPWYLYLRLLLNALFRLPSLEKTVYRGVKLHSNKGYVEGEEIVWWGFSSCTVTVGVLNSELFLGTTGPRTIFNIQCQSARDIRKHSYIPVEDEMLLLPATQFQVTSCLDQGDLRIVQLKETRPPYPLLQPVPIIIQSSINPTSQNVASVSSSQSTATKQNVTSPMPPQMPLVIEMPKPSTLSKPKALPPISKPVYRNAELERLIATAKMSAKLDLQHKELTAQDAEVVAYYALVINKGITLKIVRQIHHQRII